MFNDLLSDLVEDERATSCTCQNPIHTNPAWAGCQWCPDRPPWHGCRNEPDHEPVSVTRVRASDASGFITASDAHKYTRGTRARARVNKPREASCRSQRLYSLSTQLDPADGKIQAWDMETLGRVQHTFWPSIPATLDTLIMMPMRNRLHVEIEQNFWLRATHPIPMNEERECQTYHDCHQLQQAILT